MAGIAVGADHAGYLPCRARFSGEKRYVRRLDKVRLMEKTGSPGKADVSAGT